ncbi:MAG: sulfatase-like hydrolase/transferase [Boseongicola sp. SB0667_bin_21]|nr:sulfatase-like hydrolase/transferase [Boseongicola sp. SB0667_bin_21]
MPRQPNFLLVSTDQQRADHLGCYGNPIVRKPAIDTLASRGPAFGNFFVASPICMPNRVAILTGRMPTTNGTRHNGI